MRDRKQTERNRPRFAVVLTALIGLLASGPLAAQTIDSIWPGAQRVNELLTIRGSGFGTFVPGFTQVRFKNAVVLVDAGTPYVWRDDLIQIKVPTHGSFSGNSVPIPKTQLEVEVRVFGSVTNSIPFQVLTSATGALPNFVQRTIIANNNDTSTVLGSPNRNLARTKDAELGDVDGDDYPDLLDNNSNNLSNGTHSVLRLNNHDGTFGATRLEPLCATAACTAGAFATEVPVGGDFFANNTTYDSDFADLDGDGFLDVIQTAANNTGAAAQNQRVRILMNNNNGIPGTFLEDSGNRLPTNAFGTDGCPDDLAHGDLDNDGDVDFLVTMRTEPSFCTGNTSNTRIFLNDGTGSFGNPIVINAPNNESIHDAFIFDADRDGFNDILIGSEANSSQETRLLINDGGSPPSFSVTEDWRGEIHAGESADFNNDGLPDFALVGRYLARLYLNKSTNVGNITQINLPDAGIDATYDVELADVNLDGFVDVVAASIDDGTPQANRTVRVWINGGAGTTFFNHTNPATALLPGLGNYQRLSSDLLDVDLDGDLELYLTGGDGQNFCAQQPGQAGPLGCVPNQLFDNQKLTDACVAVPRGPRAWFRFDETTGTVAGDSVAFNNGAYTNGPTSITGVIGRTRSFDGSNDHVVVADDAAVDFGSGDFSIDFWMRTASSFFSAVLDKRQAGGGSRPGYHVYMTGGRVGFQLANASGATNFTTAATVHDGSWHHIAITVDRNGSGRFYIDGELDNTFNPTGRQGSIDNPAPLLIARHKDFSSSFYNGDLDELELHDQVIDAAEVKALFRAPGGKCSCVQPPSSQTAWFPFDQQFVTSADNIVGLTDGTRFGSPISILGVDRRALFFDGVNDYVEASDSSSFDVGSGDFSISFWLDTTQSTGTRVLQDKRGTTGSNPGYHVFMSSGRVGIQLSNGSGFTNFVDSASVADGDPHHIVITVDRNGTGRFYVDGLATGTFNPSGRQGSLNNASTLRFGRRSFGSAGWYNGSLDEFQLYKKVLSPVEISSLFGLGACKESTGNRPQPPSACFIFFPSPAPAPQFVTLDATCSSDPNNDIVSYSWSFGDGSTGGGSVTNHFYANPGFYSVTLTVTDLDGNSAAITQTVILF